MKDIQDIKGVEALEECIKMWRLNRTPPPPTAEAGKDPRAARRFLLNGRRDMGSCHFHPKCPEGRNALLSTRTQWNRVWREARL